MIAEASRKGFGEDDELQWNSYEILDEELMDEWLESIESRRTMPRVKGSKRAPKSAEQRKKISDAISAKWADPVSGIAFTEMIILGKVCTFNLYLHVPWLELPSSRLQWIGQIPWHTRRGREKAEEEADR